MEITRQPQGSVLELKVKGRLDGYWADHLSTALEEAVREGFHHIRLHLAQVDYLSSAGIRVLVQYFKQLEGLKGSLAVADPSETVLKVLQLVKLDGLLMQRAAAQQAEAVRAEAVERRSSPNAVYEVYEMAIGSSLKCQTYGNPELLNGCRFRQEQCRSVAFPDSTFGLGLGAFGSSFEDCRSSFGEFVSVAGAAAYLPTGAAGAPDYLVAAGTFVPEVNLLYGISCRGAFAHLARFEAHGEAARVSLEELVGECLDISGQNAAGLILVAETAGLVGAALKRSPALESPADSPFALSQIRDWLSFTAERAHARALTVVVGVAAKAGNGNLAPFIRPLGKGEWPCGHFHAAVFSYRPMKKGRVDLRTTVGTLFEAESLRDVLHLLGDHRELTGAGQSEFVRGACWIGPISEISAAQPQPNQEIARESRE